MAAISREWFSAYCQNAAANVLNKDGDIRFTYEQLSSSLNAASNHSASEIPNVVLNLHDNIVKLCNSKYGDGNLNTNSEYALLLTLLNIHAAYLMICGKWKEPVEAVGTDEYGFEIF